MNCEPDAPSPRLSIVIPAFNEAKRILPSLYRIIRFLESRDEAAEILVIDDNSTDQTADVMASFTYPNLRRLKNPTNRGKGYSVRRGFLEARGEWVLFTDADLSTPIEELDTLFEAAGNGADVVIGSRALDRTKILVHQSHLREWGGIVFNKFVRLVLRLKLADTQCGFKMFRREESTRIFKMQKIDGFGFDPEILYLARKAGLTIHEVPVVWRDRGGTKVRFPWDAVRMFVNLGQIRWNWMAGRYRGLSESSTR